VFAPTEGQRPVRKGKVKKLPEYPELISFDLGASSFPPVNFIHDHKPAASGDPLFCHSGKPWGSR
jgi:hypothetical protein